MLVRIGIVGSYIGIKITHWPIPTDPAKKPSLQGSGLPVFSPLFMMIMIIITISSSSSKFCAHMMPWHDMLVCPSGKITLFALASDGNRYTSSDSQLQSNMAMTMMTAT